jgi:hypothetical protein
MQPNEHQCDHGSKKEQGQRFGAVQIQTNSPTPHRCTLPLINRFTLEGFAVLNTNDYPPTTVERKPLDANPVRDVGGNVIVN